MAAAIEVRKASAETGRPQPSASEPQPFERSAARLRAYMAVSELVKHQPRGLEGLAQGPEREIQAEIGGHQLPMPLRARFTSRMHVETAAPG